MASLASAGISTKGVAFTGAHRTAPRPATLRLVARASAAQSGDQKKLIVISVTCAPAVLASNPAFAAFVESRMNGDGTGLALGVNDGALGVALAATFALVWSLFYVSQKEMGGDDGDESGLTL